MRSIEEQIREHREGIEAHAEHIRNEAAADLVKRTFYLIYRCALCGKDEVRPKRIDEDCTDLTPDELMWCLDHYKIRPYLSCLCGSSGKTQVGVANLISIRK